MRIGHRRLDRMRMSYRPAAELRVVEFHSSYTLRYHARTWEAEAGRPTGVGGSARGQFAGG